MPVLPMPQQLPPGRRDVSVLVTSLFFVVVVVIHISSRKVREARRVLEQSSRLLNMAVIRVDQGFACPVREVLE